MTMTVKERLHRAIDELPDEDLALEELRARAPESVRYLAEAVDNLADALRDRGVSLPPESMRYLAEAVQNLADSLPDTRMVVIIDNLEEGRALPRPRERARRSVAGFNKPRGTGREFRPDELFPQSDSPSADLASLLQTMHAGWDEKLTRLLEREGGSLGRDDVARRLGIPAEDVDARAAQHRLLAVRRPDGTDAFPAWQFTPEGLVQGLEQVLAAHRLSGPEVAAWFLAEEPALDGRRPLDVLKGGQRRDLRRLIDVAEAFGEQGAS